MIFRSARVAERLALPISAHEVTVSNSARGANQLNDCSALNCTAHFLVTVLST